MKKYLRDRNFYVRNGFNRVRNLSSIHTYFFTLYKLVPGSKYKHEIL